MPDQFEQLGAVYRNQPQVSDPFAGLGARYETPQAPIQHPLIHQIVQSAPIQAVLGAGDVTAKLLSRLLPEAIRPKTLTTGDPSRLAYRVGRGAGEVGTFLGAGELGGAALGAARALPAVGRAAETLAAPGVIPGIARRVLGTGAYGAAVSPDREKGLAMGLAGGALGEIPGLAARGITAASPQALTESIMKTLGKGKSLEENSKSLASDIKNAYEKNEEAASELYNPIFDRLGDRSIYYSRVKSPEFYKYMDKNIVNDYLPDLKRLHNKFMENPTLKNAHTLQSQLRIEISKISKNPFKDLRDTGIMQNYQEARKNLKFDMDHFLDYRDKTGELVHDYDAATEFFKNNVAPYKTSKSLAKIATGKITNPRNIADTFKNPNEDIMKVVKDIGDEGKNKILYSEIGKRLAMTPEKLTNEIAKLDTKGLTSYITPELHGQIDKLAPRIAARTGLQRAAGFALGASLGGGQVGRELMGAGAGAAFSPSIMRFLGRALPIKGAAKGVGKITPAIRTALLAQYLGGQQ
jgi:hypothetical protein